MLALSLPVLAEGLDISVTEDKQQVEITPDDAVDAGAQVESITLEESTVPAKEQVEVKSIEVSREAAPQAYQIETKTIDISGTLNKPMPVKAPVKLSISDRMKLLRTRIEKQNEENVRKRIELSRYRAEMAMMRKLQKMMEKQLKLTENL
jgi:hypothetical protein